MAALNVEVILKLVDQLSGPAKNAAKSLKEMVAALKQLGSAGHGAQSLAKNLSAAARIMPGMSSEMRNIQASMRGMSSGAKVFGNSIASSSRAAERSFAGIPRSVISSTREMARGLQYAQNIREKAAAEEKKGFLSSTKEMVRGLNNTSRIKDRAEAEDKRRRERAESEEKRSAASTAREKERSLNQASRTLERFEAKEKRGRESAAAEEMRSMFSAGRVLSRGMMNSQSMRDRYETSSGRGGRRRGGGGGGYYSPGFYGGYGHPHLRHGMHEVSDATGNLDTEEALLSLRGYSDADKLKISKLAGEIQTNVPQFTKARALHSLQEAAFAGAGVDFLENHAVKLAQGDVAVNSAMGEEKSKAFHSQMMEMIKSPEMKGRIKDKAFVDKWIDNSVRQAIATGGQVTPQTTYQSLKYARSGIHGFSDEFLEKYLPQLNQEMMKGKGGGVGGAAGNPIESWLRGGISMPPKQRAAWKKAGLMGKDGKPVDDELRRENPKEWTDKHFIKMLKNEGIDPSDEKNGAKVTSRMGDFFANRVAQQMAQILAIQSKQLDARAPLITGTKGATESYETLNKTWEQVLKGLNEQTKHFGAEAFIPFAKSMIPIIKGATELEQIAAKFAEDHREGLQKAAVPAMMAAGALGGTALLAGLRTGIGRSIAGAVGGYLIDGGIGALVGSSIMRGMGGLSAEATTAAGALGGVVGALTRVTGAAALFAGLIAAANVSKAIGKDEFDDFDKSPIGKAMGDFDNKVRSLLGLGPREKEPPRGLGLEMGDKNKIRPFIKPASSDFPVYEDQMVPDEYSPSGQSLKKVLPRIDGNRIRDAVFGPGKTPAEMMNDRMEHLRGLGQDQRVIPEDLKNIGPGVSVPGGSSQSGVVSAPTNMSAQGEQAGQSYKGAFDSQTQGIGAGLAAAVGAASAGVSGQGTTAGTAYGKAFSAAANASIHISVPSPSAGGAAAGAAAGAKASAPSKGGIGHAGITPRSQVALSDGHGVYG